MFKQWDYKRIGDVCIVERGGSPRPIDEYITEEADGINWIKIGDTTESMFITQTAQKIRPEGMKKSRYVQPGDFLLSNSMSFGRPYILKIDGCIHDGWLVLRDKDELFDKRFLYYYLSSKPTYEKFKQMAVGGVVNNLNSEMVRKVEVPIPSQEEQAKIADLLDKINNAIILRKQQITTLDTLIKARFVEMFGDPLVNPMGWEQATLKDVAMGKLSYGSGASAIEFDGNLRYIRITDITDTGDLNTDRKSPDSYDEKYLLHNGDILFARSGATVGKSFCYDYDKHGRAIYAGYLIRMIPDLTKVLPVYVFYYTKTEYYASFVANAQRAVAQPNINAQEYGDLTICVPPMDMQKHFASFVSQVDKSKAAVQAALDKTQVLFDSLMQEYFG